MIRASILVSLLVLFGALAPREAQATGDAYLRLVNVTGGKKPINGIAGNLTFKRVADFSAYQAVSPGEYEASVHKSKLTVELAAGMRYSLVYRTVGKKKTLTLLEDDALADAGRAQLRLYNFSDAPARLRAPNFNADLTGEVKPSSSSSAPVEALSYDIAVTVDNVDVATFESVALEHGKSYSVLLTGALPHYRGVWAADSVREE